MKKVLITAMLLLPILISCGQSSTPSSSLASTSETAPSGDNSSADIVVEDPSLVAKIEDKIKVLNEINEVVSTEENKKLLSKMAEILVLVDGLNQLKEDRKILISESKRLANADKLEAAKMGTRAIVATDKKIEESKKKIKELSISFGFSGLASAGGLVGTIAKIAGLATSTFAAGLVGVTALLLPTTSGKDFCEVVLPEDSNMCWQSL